MSNILIDLSLEVEAINLPSGLTATKLIQPIIIIIPLAFFQIKKYHYEHQRIDVLVV